MRLKMTTGLSGPTLCLGPGDEHDFEDEAEAARLVEAGFAEPVDLVALFGSSVLPAHVEIAEGKTVPLGDVVRAAFAKSGLSAESWNALSEADRDEKLAAEIAAAKPTAKKPAKKA